MSNGSHWPGGHWNFHWHDGHWYTEPADTGGDQVTAGLAIHPELAAGRAMSEEQTFSLEMHDFDEGLAIHPLDKSAESLSITAERTDELELGVAPTFTMER